MNKVEITIPPQYADILVINSLNKRKSYIQVTLKKAAQLTDPLFE